MSESLTRKQVADYLGLSISSIRRLENEGVLIPEVGEGGVRHFSEDQVEAVKADREAEAGPRNAAPTIAQTLAPTDGALTALAFAHFDRGETPVQVVQALELTAPLAKLLYEQWRELRELPMKDW